jgi:hypothetical protein
VLGLDGWLEDDRAVGFSFGVEVAFAVLRLVRYLEPAVPPLGWTKFPFPALGHFDLIGAVHSGAIRIRATIIGDWSRYGYTRCCSSWGRLLFYYHVFSTADLIVTARINITQNGISRQVNVRRWPWV